MQTIVAIIVFLVIVLSPDASYANGDCFASPKKAFSTHIRHQISHICLGEKGPLFCQSHKDSSCARISLDSGEKKLSSLNSAKGFKARKALKKIRSSRSPNRYALAVYMSILNLTRPVRFQDETEIQTGKYSYLALSHRSLSAQCFVEMLHAAYLLNKNLPQFNFNIDDRIQRCDRLIQGVRQVIDQQEVVTKNIRHFHSPMHTVFFTNRTKFNSFLIGKMGLYINVNRDDEVNRRLIEFQIGQDQIHYEKRDLKLGGLSNK